MDPARIGQKTEVTVEYQIFNQVKEVPNDVRGRYPTVAEILDCMIAFSDGCDILSVIVEPKSESQRGQAPCVFVTL